MFSRLEEENKVLVEGNKLLQEENKVLEEKHKILTEEYKELAERFGSLLKRYREFYQECMLVRNDNRNVLNSYEEKIKKLEGHLKMTEHYYKCSIESKEIVQKLDMLAKEVQKLNSKRKTIKEEDVL